MQCQCCREQNCEQDDSLCRSGYSEITSKAPHHCLTTVDFVCICNIGFYSLSLFITFIPSEKNNSNVPNLFSMEF